MFFACRVRLVFRDKSERTATKDHGGVAAIALCPDTLRGSCSGRESAIKLFQTAVSCRPSRHSPCCERLLTLPLLSMSWTILLKVWPLFRCSCMAAFGCSLRLVHPITVCKVRCRLRSVISRGTKMRLQTGGHLSRRVILMVYISSRVSGCLKRPCLPPRIFRKNVTTSVFSTPNPPITPPPSPFLPNRPPTT